VRHAIASSRGLIERSRSAVEGSPKTLRTVRTLHHASGWLDQATARLNVAIRRLDEVTENAILFPELSAGLPAHLVETTALYIGTMGRLLETSALLEATSAQLVAAAEEGILLPDPSCYRRPAPAARIPMGRLLAPKWPSCEQVPIITIHLRRRRSSPKSGDEPSRRVTRCRAPPSLGSAPLSIAVLEKNGETSWLRIKSR